MALFSPLLLLAVAVVSLSKAQPIREVQPTELDAVTSLPTGRPIENVEDGEEEEVLAPAGGFFLPFLTGLLLPSAVERVTGALHMLIHGPRHF